MNLHPAWLVVVVGAALVIVGLVWISAPGIPLGRLPGDIRIETGTARIYIPITTCIVISVVLSAILWVANYIAR